MNLAANFDNMCRAITGLPLTNSEKIINLLVRLENELDEDTPDEYMKRVIDDCKDAVKRSDLNALDETFNILWNNNWRFRYRSTLNELERLIIKFNQ